MLQEKQFQYWESDGRNTHLTKFRQREGGGRSAAAPRSPLKIGAACPSLEKFQNFWKFWDVSDISSIFGYFRAFSDVSDVHRCFRTFLAKCNH